MRPLEQEGSPDLPGLMELVERLPPFHKVLERCMVTMSKPYASAREISGWIESDSALSGRVLSLANSSYYGLPQKVLRTERAVVLLGRRALEEVFYSFYIQGLFTSQDGSEAAELWTGSLRAGICAKELTLALGMPSSEGKESDDAGAYLAGLLHDAGRLLLLTHYPAAYHRAHPKGGAPGDVVDREKQAWGFDHAELGRAMAEKWGLPPSVSRAIEWHHRPDEAGEDALLASLVHVADILSESAASGGDPVAAVRSACSEQCLGRLGLDEDALPVLRKVMRQLAEKMLAYGGLVNGGAFQVPTGGA